MRHQKLGVIAFLVVGASASGCNGCLSYDDYRLVDGPIGGGGAGGGGGGSGGGGNDPGICNLSTDPSDVFASFVVAVGDDPGTPGCGTLGTPPSIEVVELDELDGTCVANDHVLATPGTILAAAPAVRVGRDDQVFVAGSFRKGALSFPKACTGAGDVILDGETDATAALYFALLRRSGPAFCTVWAKRAFTNDVGVANALHVDGTNLDNQYVIGVAGSVGGALVHFGDATETALDVNGGPFLATLDPVSGAIHVNSLKGASPGDAALGLTVRMGDFTVTGVVASADPTCHACKGTDGTDDGGNSPCGGGGGGGSGGGGGGALDLPNAMLWSPDRLSDACGLDTFGSNAIAGDAQIGFGVSFGPDDFCQRFWGGLAGKAPWSTDGVALFEASGRTTDAFVAANGVDDPLVCRDGSQSPFTVRLVPSIDGATAWSHRVAAQACGAGPIAATVVRGAAGGRVDIHRCAGLVECDPTAFEAPLAANAATQLLLTGFDTAGEFSWSGAVGPLRVDAAAAPLPGRARDDLASASSGRSYVVFSTDGPLVAENFDPATCDFASMTEAGTWLVALTPEGAEKKATCAWSKRLGP